MNLSKMLRLAGAPFALLLSITAQAADEYALQQMSLRVGFDSEDSVNIAGYELVGTFSSPCSFSLGEQYTAVLQIEAGLGLLSGENKDGMYGRIAPALKLNKAGSAWSLVLSSGPSIYSEEQYGDLDLGGHFQFMSSAGLSWRALPDWELGYRFQHSSNAHLCKTNPGLDMHVLSIAHQF